MFNYFGFTSQTWHLCVGSQTQRHAKWAKGERVGPSPQGAAHPGGRQLAETWTVQSSRYPSRETNKAHSFSLNTFVLRLNIHLLSVSTLAPLLKSAKTPWAPEFRGTDYNVEEEIL